MVQVQLFGITTRCDHENTKPEKEWGGFGSPSYVGLVR